SGSSYTSNSSTTLYAIWTPNTYTVTYNANGGTSGSVTTQTKTYGVSMTISSSATPTRTGYTFKGWGTYASDTSVNYSAGGSYTSNSAITLYAIWELNTYTVSYDANGGTGAPSSGTKTYGTTYYLSTTEPTRTDYEFMGWSLSTNSIIYGYTDSATLSYTNLNQNLEFTAIWEYRADVYPEIVEPNATYNSGTEIIVSYNIYNDTSTDIKPSNAIEATLTVTNTDNSGSSSVIMTETQEVIIPSGESNLVYFKVTIPESSSNITFKLEVETGMTESSTDNNTIIDSYNVYAVVDSQTSDTTFESAPVGFDVPSSYASTPTMGQTLDSNTTWSVWEWVNNNYSLVTYGIDLDLSVTITADEACATETVSNGITTMKSGYGFTIEVESDVSSYLSYTMPDESAYTILQNANVYFPEFEYSFTTGKYRTLDLVGDVFMFEENENTMTTDGVQDYRRTHFIPIYFPDGNYTIKTYAYNLWTPAGMINTTETTTQIVISGDIYDDWVITR
ncbi:MAG: InlB B-repeat-containing protein, partial [Clostridia bacterium]